MQNNGQRKIDEIRFKLLIDLHKMIQNSRQEILDFAIEAVVIVTSSKIGYIYFASDDEKELTLHAWSKDVMQECKVNTYPDSYKVCETGLWGEAIRQRKAVITNNYDKSPYKQGFPEGHVCITKHMNIPVFDEDKIVIVAGVGNKEEDYTEEDVQQLTLVMDAVCNILKRKQVEEDLKQTNENLEKIIDERTFELEEANKELYEVINKQQLIETELKKNETLFRGMFDNAAAGIVLLSPQGHIILANEVCTDLLGYKSEELRGKNMLEIIHPDHAEDASENFINMINEGVKKQQIERKMIKQNGEALWAHINITSIRNSENKLESFLIVATDITFRVVSDRALKRNALELKRRKDQLQLIMDNVPALISYADLDLKYKFVNAHYENMFKIDAGSIIGKHVSEIVGEKTFSETKDRYEAALKGETQNFEINFNNLNQQYFLNVTYIPHKFDDKIEGLFILVMDITKMKENEIVLTSYSNRLKLASIAGNIGVWELDIVTNNLIWDKRMFELYCADPDDFKGAYKTWKNRVHPDDKSSTELALRKARKDGRFDWEFRIICPNKKVKIMKAAALTQYDNEHNAVKMTGVSWDITVQKEMELNLKKLSRTDPLTGASNRRFFMLKAKEEIKRSKRYGMPLSLLMMDIDNFKQINDVYGHDTGDEVLKKFVNECLTTLRDSDIFSRIGGEEFAVLLTNTYIEDAKGMAERLRIAIEDLVIEHSDLNIECTVSIGLTEIFEKDSLEDALKRSDAGLYAAKQNGRNRVVAN
ncbi:MAG: diguanylate cyclase [Desulfobacterales bacterium]|nr:diguanylate cyclase [Desulfobacterales bacterium]